MNNGLVGDTVNYVAQSKLDQSFIEAFFKRGGLCNILVCLGVWIAMAGRSVVDKIVVTIFPVSAFVAAGLEHCVANHYFFSIAILNGVQDVSFLNCIIRNLTPVTLGNLIGGAGMVGMVYWIVYRREMI